MTFALDINKFIEKTKGNSNLIVKRTVTGILRKVVMKSPVGNPDLWVALRNGEYVDYQSVHGESDYVGGRFRANWQVGVDSVPTEKLESFDKNGSKTIALGTSKIPVQAAGHAYYIANNLDYAQALEDGHSTQSPPGNMVAGTVAEFESIMRGAVSEFR